MSVNYNTGKTIDKTFTYDAAGNIITATDDCCDMDSFRYDSTNRLIGTNTNAYTYNAENVRIRNLCGDSDTTYVYNTNAKLSSMLMKTTDGVVTKYVYGRGLIGEETNGVFKTYHFDYRGSTVAITNINGNVTDTFEYDTYGKVINRAGNSDVIFLYNGRDGVVTDSNGLIYMRARYYSPELRRFINADILAGRIDNAVTLNRYAYANGNPVSFVDPRGLSAERGSHGSIVYDSITYPIYVPNHLTDTNESLWRTIHTLRDHDFSFDKWQFFTGVDAGDIEGIAYGLKNNIISPNSKSLDAICRGMGIVGVVSSALDSTDNTYVTFEFQEYNDSKRVIITYGSSDAAEAISEYADGVPRYFSHKNYNSVLAMGFMDTLYTKATGNKVKFGDRPDMRVTMDKNHSGSGDIAYLSIADDDSIMQTPIVYPKDEVSIGKRTGFLYLGFDVEVSVPLGDTTPVGLGMQNRFLQAIIDKKLQIVS